MSSPLDLPSLSTRPSYLELLQILTALAIQPSTWIGDEKRKEEDERETKAVNAWLPTIFRSGFGWFVNGEMGNMGESVSADGQREEIMELAARRLAERCGRSAQPDMTRTWTVPQSLVPGSPSDLQIQIHEPGLTEGNTGHKTWGTAFALIKQLSFLRSDPGFFAHLLDSGESGAGFEGCVLELGSGTGLLGIAASVIWSCRVVLTDLEIVVPNLKRNMDANLSSVHARAGALVAETLDWAEHPASFASESIPRTFPIILASDPIYDTEQVELLANTIDRFLDAGVEARALVAVPLRDGFSRGLAAQLGVAMEERGFAVLDRGMIGARDDFGDGRAEVTIQRDLYGRMGTK